jgi:hypothetical protein
MGEQNTIQSGLKFIGRPGGAAFMRSLTKYSAEIGRAAINEYVSAINQRVKSAIGTDKKIDTDSRVVGSQKAASTGRSPFGRVALWSLFATKLLPRGGSSAKVY